MSVVERKSWHCDVCGFEWLRTEGIIPAQCASSKCRSRKWNIQGVELNEKRNGGADRGIRAVAAQKKSSGKENSATTEKGGAIKSEIANTGKASSGASAVAVTWFPNSMCPHGWMNSFACAAKDGGCKR